MAGFLARMAGTGRIWRFAALSAGLIMTLWVTGPFGTALTMEAGERAQYFLATGVLIQAACLATAWLAKRLMPGIGLWQLLGLAAFGGAIPGAFIIRAGLGIWAPVALTHVTLPALFAQVLFVNLGVFAILGLLVRRSAGAKTDQTRPTNPLAARLPLPLREARIDAIVAQDHYLEVHTSLGPALVHMTMREAERLMRETAGLRVHRSYWISLAAIERHVRRSGEHRLVVRGGIEVPVSRRRVKYLREAMRHA